MKKNSKSSCPCCSGPLVQQFHKNNLGWYCSKCHQAMPNLGGAELADMIQPRNLASRSRHS